MKTRLAGLLGIGISALLFVACGQATSAPSAQPAADEKPKYGGILRNLLDRDPRSCDQGVNPGGDRVSGNSCASMINGLLKMTTGDKLEPDLAERWETTDGGKQWTFYLRKDVKWHDGKPFTAEDVVYNFNRWLNPPKGIQITNTPLLFRTFLERVEKVDDYTVRFHMKFPPASFLLFVAESHSGFYPKHILETLELPTMTAMKSVIGTGPFKYKQEIRGSTYEMQRNENYFRPGVPYLDGVRYTVLPDPSTRLAALTTNQVDVYSGAEVPPEDAVTIETGANKDRIKSLQLDNLQVQWVGLNMKVSPTNDPRVREAIWRALDQREAVRVLGVGRGATGYRMASYGAWSLPKEELDRLPGMGPREQELAKAKQLLAEAGYPNGLTLDKPLYVRNVTRDEDLAVWMTQQLNLIGIKSQAKALETAALGQITDNRDFQVKPNYGGGGNLDDPDNNLDRWQCDHIANYLNWCDPEYDRLFTVQSGTLDPAKRKEIVLQMQRMLVKTNAYIPLFWVVFHVAHWDYVRGWDPRSSNKHCACMVVWDTAWLAK